MRQTEHKMLNFQQKLRTILRHITGVSASRHSRSPFIILLSTIFLQCSAFCGFAEIYSAEVYTQPDKIYVNQPFKLILEISLSRGQDIDNIRIQDLPNDPDFITLEPLKQERVRKTRRLENGEVADIMRFQADALCHKRVSRNYNPLMRCDIVERKSRGFFSFSSSSRREIRISPFTLSVLELPEHGRPDNFSGAVGQFRLKGNLSKTAVRPGDIITLSLELTGSGFTEDAPAPNPGKADQFKSYPPKEIIREKNLIRTEQIYIPKSTNAVAIPPARFNYFNPKSGQYEVCSTSPFEITFTAVENASRTNRIDVISSAESSTAAPVRAKSISKEVNTVFHRILPVVIACLTLLAASFIFLSLVKINKWAAAVSAALTIALGGFLMIKASRYEAAETVLLRTAAQVYLAPSRNAPSIMHLPESAEVIPLESTECWTRIEADRHRGWIENERLKEN
ncbi:MAG: hypothetical protein R6V06_07840 [Kiritimatiellia bacterium]